MTSNNKFNSGKSSKQEEYNVVIQYINSLIKYKSNINQWVIFELLLTFVMLVVMLVFLFGTIQFQYNSQMESTVYYNSQMKSTIYQPTISPLYNILVVCLGIILTVRFILLLRILRSDN